MSKEGTAGQSTEGLDASHAVQEILVDAYTAETVGKRLALLQSDLSPNPIKELDSYFHGQLDGERNQNTSDRYLFTLVLVGTGSDPIERPYIALKTARSAKSFTKDKARDRLDRTTSEGIILREGELQVKGHEVHEVEAAGFVDGSKDAMIAVLETHFNRYNVRLTPGHAY